MPNYALYFFDKDDHIIRREDIDVENDEQAMEEARVRDHAFCVEVWQGARQAGTVHPA